MTSFVVYTGIEGVRHQLTVVPFNSELKYLQSLVGGLIEHYIIDEELNDLHIDMWIDDEGKLKNLKPTIALMNDGQLVDVIFGNCVFSKYNDEGETLGLEEYEVGIVDRWIREQDIVGLKDKDGHTFPCLAVDIRHH